MIEIFNVPINFDRMIAAFVIGAYSIFIVKNIDSFKIKSYLIFGFMNIFVSLLSIPVALSYSYISGINFIDILTLQDLPRFLLMILYAHFVIGVVCFYYSFTNRQ